MVKYTSESTIKPPEWDKDSSPTVVYHNIDIVEVPAAEDRPKMYAYTVEEYTRAEYLEYDNNSLRQTINAFLGVS